MNIIRWDWQVEAMLNRYGYNPLDFFFQFMLLYNSLPPYLPPSLFSFHLQFHPFWSFMRQWLLYWNFTNLINWVFSLFPNVHSINLMLEKWMLSKCVLILNRHLKSKTELCLLLLSKVELSVFVNFIISLRFITNWFPSSSGLHSDIRSLVSLWVWNTRVVPVFLYLIFTILSFLYTHTFSHHFFFTFMIEMSLSPLLDEYVRPWGHLLSTPWPTASSQPSLSPRLVSVTLLITESSCLKAYGSRCYERLQVSTRIGSWG